MKMKSLILLIIGLSFTAMGCARSYVGTFTGTVSVVQQGSTQPAAGVPAQISFTVDSGNQVQGTMTSSAGNANITGSPSGGALNNVSLTVTSQGQISYGQTSGAMLVVGGAPYIGSLSYSGDRLTGTLTQGGTAGMPQGYPTMGGSSLQIDVRRQ